MNVLVSLSVGCVDSISFVAVGVAVGVLVGYVTVYTGLVVVAEVGYTVVLVFTVIFIFMFSCVGLDVLLAVGSDPCGIAGSRDGSAILLCAVVGCAVVWMVGTLVGYILWLFVGLLVGLCVG